MTLVEAIQRTRGRHHHSFIILSFIPPAILLFFAVFDSQIASAPYLKASDDFFEARLRVLFRRCVAWKEVRGFRVDGHTIVVDVDDRTRKIRLRDVVDRDAALTWSAEQFRRRGIAESVPQ